MTSLIFHLFYFDIFAILTSIVAIVASTMFLAVANIML